ncbi:MAG: hypothetical protein IJP92_11355 [Lachnospiraceae bacterium]|nr:hypothetical protein [Lachnospiraceae bacterium]
MENNGFAEITAAENQQMDVRVVGRPPLMQGEFLEQVFRMYLCQTEDAQIHMCVGCFFLFDFFIKIILQHVA